MSHPGSLASEAILLLKQLIGCPSFSKEEQGAADIIGRFLQDHAVPVNRMLNNVWATNQHFDPGKPTILLNSHHDTVKPNPGYSRDPFTPSLEDGKLYGLGSNDAGGCLVSLIAVFLYFYSREGLQYNLLLAATAEEEISGRNGIEALLPQLGELSFAIVGEPTLMQMAIAEKGLMVLDCNASGIAGHAARDEGENAIYKAVQDITWFQNFRFPKESVLLGPVKMSVTVINAGSQHNVMPASCAFTVDVRVTDCYTNDEVLAIIREQVQSEVVARSTRLRSSSIPGDHPIVTAGKSLGLTTYGSPTMSDQALLNIPSLKIGPGDSARSHMADEFVYIAEIESGIETYIKLLDQLLTSGN